MWSRSSQVKYRWLLKWEIIDLNKIKKYLRTEVPVFLCLSACLSLSCREVHLCAPPSGGVRGLGGDSWTHREMVQHPEQQRQHLPGKPTAPEHDTVDNDITILRQNSRVCVLPVCLFTGCVPVCLFTCCLPVCVFTCLSAGVEFFSEEWRKPAADVIW